jgi:hypothetical protein
VKQPASSKFLLDSHRWLPGVRWRGQTQLALAICCAPEPAFSRLTTTLLMFRRLSVLKPLLCSICVIVMDVIYGRGCIHVTQVGATGCGLGYFRLMAESTICL